MAWHRRWLGVSLIGLMAGCADTLPDWAEPTRSLSEHITQPTAPPVVRSQTPESQVLPKPPSAAAEPLLPPPPNFGASRSVGPKLPAEQPSNAGTGVIQTSFANRGKVRIRVRAWVNGQPIFEEEVMQAAGPELRRVLALPDSQRAEKMAELFNTVIDQIVDQEVMYQEAVKKIIKFSPKGTLEKMRGYVDAEFDKSVERMRKAGATEAQIREVEPTARRMMERNLISTEYARSRIKPPLEAIGLRDIRDYYEAHMNEFRSVDKVTWQDIFIPINPNLPALENVKAFAEQMINKCRTPDDFNRLMVYNEGDSKLRGGDGLGQRRGEIRPAELEDVLFRLNEGEIGPVIPFSTGVHLVRVTKRERAGQMPLDAHVQKTIRKKLEGQLADAEYRRIVRELKTRAVVRVERDSP